MVVFDKTGTLNEDNEFKVTDQNILGDEVLAKAPWLIVKLLKETSFHPLAHTRVRID